MTMQSEPVELNNVAYSIPAEMPKNAVFESESHILKPTESEILKYQNLTQSQEQPQSVQNWSVPAENYQAKGGNKDQTLISLPQGAYYGKNFFFRLKFSFLIF
jgi:hypothetical protein